MFRVGPGEDETAVLNDARSGFKGEHSLCRWLCVAEAADCSVTLRSRGKDPYGVVYRAVQSPTVAVGGSLPPYPSDGPCNWWSSRVP